MDILENYPKKVRNRDEFVKFTLKVTKALISELQRKNVLCGYFLKPGVFIPVEVTLEGYNVPPSVSTFDTEDECKQACKAHNAWAGYSVDEAIRIIWFSMKNANMPKEVIV